MSAVERLIEAQLGAEATRRLLEVVEIDPTIGSGDGDDVTRGDVAMALGACLFDGLLRTVPSGAAYVEDRRAEGGKVCFDHGAIRTILFADGPTGALPAGQLAFSRILEPLGYAVAGTYPLPRLNMTGRAYCHLDHAETIPQYFVSELHVDRFDEDFGVIAKRVFGQSRDPLGAAARTLLKALSATHKAPFVVATAGLPELLAAFGRHHDEPTLDDYHALRGASPEAAWIATEGNAFNHATDRVADVEALAERQRLIGRPIKERVEISTNGRVRQTAYRADPVTRRFRAEDGTVEQQVPGSFYEFITRDSDPETGRLDLSFDSGNATGIFQMTKVA
ncbi:DUF1338 family protein [Rhizorhabdus sp.]|uniref:2-oxoadipate dioxygenase/decarboxylase family protein n=1 Tax=Rhizorhabdus sp. TaxID=1968843 RepID=UPI0025CED73B|nr:DUF1338 family protein [Rhizorhabdus sp.]